jgi:asparagine synthase (glutamine-hydrolysing)
MCGIFGCLAPSLMNIPSHLRNMAATIAYRGPDHQGFYTEPGVGLGMVRLSIIDLSTGNQPIFSPDKRHVIFFNGEIYNHLELRSQLEGYPFSTESDTETLLAAYLRWGEDCLPRLNGMFAVAIWDSLEKNLFVARDRYGIKPFYYHSRGETFCFASEAKALLSLLPERSVDMEALGQYLQFGYVPSPLCIFSGVKKLLPGYYAKFQKGILRLSQWHHRSYSVCKVPSKRLVQELDELLAVAVRKEMLSDVPVGVFLSGGLDSSLVAAYASQVTPDIHSFALGFHEATHDETADAQLAADHLGLRHHTTFRLNKDDLRLLLYDVAESLDEPFADSTVLPLLAISRRARKDVKVVLTGWGGDEIFMGYPTMQAHVLAQWYRQLPNLIREKVIPYFVDKLPVSGKYMSFEFKAHRFIQGTLLSPEQQHLRWMGYFAPEEIPLLVARDIHIPNLYGIEQQMLSVLSGENILDHALELDARLFLEGNGLFQADRMSMRASLEARVPLLNPELVEWADSLDWRYKMPGLRLKHLLKETGKKYLPKALLHKPKKGFGPPTSHWICGPLRDEVTAGLSKERLEAAGLINPTRVECLLTDHLSGKADHGRILWCLFSLHLWHENFIRVVRKLQFSNNSIIGDNQYVY